MYIEGIFEDYLGKNTSEDNTQMAYLAPQFNYANHSPQKYDKSMKIMCPGLPAPERGHRKNDNSSYHVLSTYEEWIFGEKVLCAQYL